MGKKAYIMWLIIGSLVFSLILPMINYQHDQWRVLHCDYESSYIDITINKSFLKTAYLLDNPQKYEMLMFGSSRNAAFVESDIAPHAYNAYSDFGVIGNHLHTLRVLLKHGVVPKRLWIGLNDFDIWKDPDDFQKDYSKCPYPETFYSWLSWYQLYFYKLIDTNDLDIWRGKKYLEKSDRIYRQNLKVHKKALIQKEEKIQKKGNKWRHKMTKMAATLLGYQDTPSVYRIDQTIDEIKQLLLLSKRYSIKTTFFIYPSFYKTYVLYNQKKMESFKRKLVKVTDFYDFYKLDATAYDELKWHDTSHFLYSVGREIEIKIQQGVEKINKENIEAVLYEERTLRRSLLQKIFPLPYIMRLNTYLEIPGLRQVWDPSLAILKVNTQLKIVHTESRYQLKSGGKDPYFFIDGYQASAKNVMMYCELESPKRTLFQIFYKTAKEQRYTEKNSAKFTVYKGHNVFRLLIPASLIRYGLRIDPVSDKGVYQVKNGVFGINDYG